MSGLYRISLCFWCHGTGFYPKRGNRCTACNGRGRVYAHGPWSLESPIGPKREGRGR